MTPGERTLADRYEIGRRLGRGGMAEVYLGTDTRLGRQVAVKLLSTQLSGEPSFRQRFRQEAQAAARMTHPTIVRVFDAGEDTFLRPDGHEIIVPYIVMEYVPGQQLRDLMVAAGPMDARRAQHYMDGVLTALEYSHRAGVVHRDIKPGNVMVTPDDEIKVMDFGIARAISDTAGTIAQTTAILGTASYFSPEQARGEQVDGRSDLYSAGIMLYEMLTGRVPFQGDSAVAVAYQHVTEAPMTPSAVNPNVSPAMDAVVLKALAKHRDDRFQSASEFRDALEEAARGVMPAFATAELATAAAGAPTQLFGAAPSSVSATEAALSSMADDDDRAPQVQRRPPAMWIWGAGVLIMAIVAAIAIWVLGLPKDQQIVETGITVPDVTGLTYEEASAQLTAAGFVVEREARTSDEHEADHVIETEPGAGRQVPRGQTITVTVSTGPSPIMLPNLAGLSRERAEETLVANGLALGSVREQDSGTVAAGLVISSDPVANAQVAPGSRINIVVSTGMVQLPDVTGQPLADATSTLQSLGLLAVAVADASCPAAEGNPVTAQSLPAGSLAQRSSVSLTYCTGSAAPTATATPTPSSSPATSTSPGTNNGGNTNNGQGNGSGNNG